MQLSNRLSPIAETLLNLPHGKIAKFIGLFLFIYIAYLLAQITWLILDEPPLNSQNLSKSVMVTTGTASVSYDLSSIQALNLFGLYNQTVVIDKEPEEIEDAPETNLNLTLTGVVASDDEHLSAAIIQNKGSQEVYAIDETIDGTRAVLKKVYYDRVHIRHSGRLETLMLDGIDYKEPNNNKMNTSQRPKAPISKSITDEATAQIDKRKNAELAKQAQELRDDINEDPGNITDYLKIAPKRENGEIIGYQLMPGKNPNFFQSAGLKSGDVAIQMNGYDLSQGTEAAQALKALKEEQEVSLLVDRNGDITEILFSINE